MANDELLKVSYPALDAMAGGCAQALQQLQSEIGAMDTQVKNIVAQGWVGEASGAFTATELKWSTAANDLAGLLGQISRTIDNARQTYLSMEQTNAQRFA